MAAEVSRSGTSADSYIGSFISLTSKCEIRYEGVLYNINTEESSIGLRNVRSFGTEGRKKDGPQIPASDKIYEYILFRGSDIKDLQVKSSPTPQTTSIHNDPAIIQSHYSHPVPASTSLPSGTGGTVAESSHTAQLGLPRSPFQGGLPPYQPGGSLSSWGSAPPPAGNGSGLSMPTMYWQGYYAPTGASGLPHLQQPSMLRPPPGLSIPPMQQPMQYPTINASIPSAAPNLTDYPRPFLAPVTSTPMLPSMALPSASTPTQTNALVFETSANLMPNRPPATSLSATSLGPTLPFAVPLSSSIESHTIMSQNMASIVGSKPRPVPTTTVSYLSTSQPIPSIIGAPILGQVETSVPLVTPVQLLQPGSSAVPSSLSSQKILKEFDGKPPESKFKPLLPEPSLPAPAEVKEPILPLPTPTERKLNGTTLQTQGYRGRGRGRGNVNPRLVTKFTEDFDFTAMNEKFNKDEVWGHLGKSKSQSRDREGDPKDNEDDDEEDGTDVLRLEDKSVYVKDDFFDSLSCNALDRGLRNGRTKFSEQLKIDAETFGDFPRHRPNRGGGRGFHGGGRARGSYYGRGYGYVGRGRGHSMPN